jgi:hypothetical protein
MTATRTRAATVPEIMETMTRSQIERRISEIGQTPRAMIGSDEGTHGNPATWRIYEEITGYIYAIRAFGGAAHTTHYTVAEVEESTHGRINWFAEAKADVSRLQTELKHLRKALLKM